MAEKITQVVSSNIASVTYNDETKYLVIEFNSGAQYRYEGVEQEVHDALISAPSVGKHFNNFIKDVYPAERI